MTKNTLAFLFFLIWLPFWAQQVDTLRIQSKSMQKEISNVIILPELTQQSTKQFAVVYLLHGAGGSYKSWINRVPELQAYAEQHHVIIVCPDGGKTSWYLNSPVDSSMRYETYIIDELIKEVDRTYPTIKSKQGRAITGLSMGGHGALYLSFKHQDVFGAAGSMSGGVDLRPFNGWDLPLRLGSYAKHPEHWEQHSVINLVHLLRPNSLQLTIDCGLDDFFLAVNEKLHQKLRYQRIPHTFTLRPGAHNWAYWKNSIQYQLLFFSTYFNN